jgi:flagellar L-ring protein precursor FlgH
MDGRRAVRACAAIALAGMTSVAVAGEQSSPKAPASDNYDVLYAHYLQAARQMQQVPVAAPTVNWMTNLGLDPRARNVNDLVTIRVVESVNATGTADSSLDKNSKAAAGAGHLFGVESQYPSWLDPENIVGASYDSTFKGGGTTQRSGTLNAAITARVTEVLPNGDLVLEGVREIDINGDRQIIVLTGVVRPSSINRSNVVSSVQVGQLRIRYFGRGLIKDNLQPGWLMRVLNKIF